MTATMCICGRQGTIVVAFHFLMQKYMFYKIQLTQTFSCILLQKVSPSRNSDLTVFRV